MTSLALRLAGLTGAAALSGCVACGISSSSPVEGAAGSGAAPTVSGGGSSSGGAGSGGSPVVSADCPDFAEWDPALRVAVQEATGSEAPEPAAWEVLNVVKVEGGGTGVGVECLVGLQVFEWNNASSVFTASALSNLPKLGSGRFAGTEVDFSGVHNADSWWQLTLVDAPSTDLGALAKFTGLERLTLSGTGAPDLTDIAAMTALFHLSLEGIPVSDLSPLASHPALRLVFLNETGVTDIAPLVSITNIASVALLGNLLDSASLETHIPALLAAGACVEWEDPPGTVHREPAICFDPK